MLDKNFLIIGFLMGLLFVVSGINDIYKNKENKQSPNFIFSVGQVGIGAMLLVALVVTYFKMLSFG